MASHDLLTSRDPVPPRGPKTNVLEHTELKSENFPHRKPAVFFQTDILSSLIFDSFAHCLTIRMDEDHRTGTITEVSLRYIMWHHFNLHYACVLSIRFTW